MTRKMSKGLARLVEDDPGRSYKTGTSPLYVWIDAHCEEIEVMRYEKRWSWEKLVGAAVEDGVPVENNSATWKRCSTLFTRIRALRKKRVQLAGVPEALLARPETFAPSRVPADWRPTSVKDAYADRSLENDQMVSVADQKKPRRNDQNDKEETPDERAERIINEVEQKIFAQRRARGPGFLTD